MVRWVNTRLPLGDEGYALLDYLVGGRDQRLLSPVHVSADHGGEAHDGLENGGFPGAVGAHHGNDFALADTQRYAIEGDDRAVVDGYVDEVEEFYVCLCFRHGYVPSLTVIPAGVGIQCFHPHPSPLPEGEGVN